MTLCPDDKHLARCRALVEAVSEPPNHRFTVTNRRTAAIIRTQGSLRTPVPQRSSSSRQTDPAKDPRGTTAEDIHRRRYPQKSAEIRPSPAEPTTDGGTKTAIIPGDGVVHQTDDVSQLHWFHSGSRCSAKQELWPFAVQQGPPSNARCRGWNCPLSNGGVDPD